MFLFENFFYCNAIFKQSHICSSIFFSEFSCEHFSLSCAKTSGAKSQPCSCLQIKMASAARGRISVRKKFCFSASDRRLRLFSLFTIQVSKGVNSLGSFPAAKVPVWRFVIPDARSKVPLAPEFESNRALRRILDDLHLKIFCIISIFSVLN